MIDDKKNNSRTLINLIGIPLLLGIIYLGEIYFTTLIFISIFISTMEFNEMCKKKNINIQLMWIYLFYTLIFITHFISFEIIRVENIELLCLLLIVICLSEVFRFKPKPLENIGSSIFIIIWVGLFLNYIVLIRLIPDHGMILTLVMFLSVWLCDTAAFFFGSKFGVKKILPTISPKKTWVGTVSGFISVLIFNFILLKSNIFMHLNYNFTISDVFIFGFIFGVIGQIGDFVESMIKRQFNIKDSGTLLRGHGGFLDRMDSLILVAPCYYLYLQFVMGING